MSYVRGGWAKVDDGTGAATANNNIVTITSGASVDWDVLGGYAQSDSGAATASGNTVTVRRGASVGSVKGAYAHVDDGTGAATANNNTVTVSSGAYVDGDVSGAYAFAFVDSGTGAATANSNTVTISSTAYVGSDVYGGWAEFWGTGTATATGNTVTISGGTVGGDVYGGLAEVYGTGTATTATGNTVTISGSPDLSASTLYGGGGTGGAGSDFFTGNTLNLKTSGLTVAGLQNFENLNFYLPATMANGETALTVTGEADITDSTVRVGVNGGSSALEIGETVTLISAGTLTGAADLDGTRAGGIQGIANIYKFDLSVVGDELFATAAERDSNAQLKALLEGRLAGLAFASQGYDLIVGPGMYAAMLETKRQGAGIVPFAVVGGGTNRYDTGSHIDVDGVHLLAGMAWRANIAAASSLVTGAFFEAGWGSYDSRNSFNNLPSVKGKGDTDVKPQMVSTLSL